MSIRKSMIEPQQLDPNEILAEVVTRNGEKYYFSDSLNWILFENLAQPPYSIWAYVLDVVPQASRPLLPDMADIVSHAARTIGTARFGVPRLPPENMPHKAPRAALVEHWPADAHQPRPACAAAGGEDHHGGRDPDVEGRSAHGGGGVRGLSAGRPEKQGSATLREGATPGDYVSRPIDFRKYLYYKTY
jgi:hypothetical protein